MACEEGTEHPFSKAYWNNKRAGIYVDIVSGEPPFRSKDKFKSGTGWPSFVRSLAAENIVEKPDCSLFYTRSGLRYSINSVALRFVPASDLGKEDYKKITRLFGVQAK